MTFGHGLSSSKASFLAALSTLGGLLDLRRGAWRAEAWRCGIAVAAAGLLFFTQ